MEGIKIEHIETQETSDSHESLGRVETFEVQAPILKSASKQRRKRVQLWLVAGIILTCLSVLAVALIVTQFSKEDSTTTRSGLSNEFEGTTGTTSTDPPTAATLTGQDPLSSSPSSVETGPTLSSPSPSSEQTEQPTYQSSLRPTSWPTRVSVTEDTSTPTAAPISNVLEKTRSPVAAPTYGPTGVPTTTPTAEAPQGPTIAAPNCPVFDAPPPLPGKKGIGMALRNEGEEGSWLENLPRIISLDPYWNYSWGTRRIEAQPDDIEFVPMIWASWNQEKTEQHITDVLIPQIESGKAKRLLGFNEPDREDQANMPVERALQTWPLLESTSLPLVSPSATHADGTWMLDFMGKSEQVCNRVDWIGVHWYGGADFQSFADQMKSIYDIYERPLLITEFAPADWNAATPADNRWSQADVLEFMKAALPWLEEQTWIAGYAWFSFKITSRAGTSSALFDDNGNMTALGRYYASVKSDNPAGDQSIQV